MSDRTTTTGCDRRAMLAGTAAICGAGLAQSWPAPALAATAATATPLRFSAPVPVTATSVPWGTAMDGGAREALVRRYAYVEEEFFVSGVAAVYGPGGETRHSPGQSHNDFAAQLRPLAKMMRDAVPFTTRAAMLRPADMRKFSGVVHLIPWHNLDATTYVEKNLLRGGDVWIGIECCGGTRFGVEEKPSGGVANLKGFNPQRYAALSLPSGEPSDWPDLQPGRLGEAFKSINFGRPDADHNIFRQEISRSYAQGPDILTQAAELLRQGGPTSPLAPHEVRRIFTAGRSGQSTILQPYVQFHHAAARARLGHVPFDGYMIRVGAMPTNRPAGSVLVLVQSEAEAKGIGPAELATLTDSDDPMFRYYEIAGVGHGITARPNVSGTIGTVVPKGVQGISDVAGHSDYEPYDKISLPLVWGMWRNIHAWLDKGVPMPRSARIERDAAAPGNLARDRFGNAKGGIRLPWMEYPDAEYVGVISPKNPLEGGMKHFDEAKMRELYGSRRAWQAHMWVHLRRLARERWISAVDIPLMMRRGVTPALALGDER